MGISKVPLYCKRNFSLNVMRGSRNVCLESGLLLALQRFCHWNGVSLAGRLWPNITCWLRSFASFSGLWTSTAMEPYSIVISHMSAPLPLWKRAWMYSDPRISLLSLACDIEAQTNHMCPIYIRIKRRGMGFRTPCIHRQTHTRVWVLADHRDPPHTPPPPPRQFKSCPTSILPSASATPDPLPWIHVCNYFNLRVCKWMLAFLK